MPKNKAIGSEIAADPQQLQQKCDNFLANGPYFWTKYFAGREKLPDILCSFICHIAPANKALNSGCNVASRKLLT